MRFLCLQHVSYEGPARINEWIESRNFSLRSHFFAAAPAPALDSFDALIVMGGPMGVYETEKYPWMAEEIAFVARAIGAGKKTLGICLGSQIIAAALGARVAPQGHQEIGWFPVMATPNRVGDPFYVFHWHGDASELPEGATPLLYSEGCPNQAYFVGEKVLALQCHLEIDEPTLESWIPNLPKHATGKFVQTPEEMRADAKKYLPECGVRLFAWLDKFFD